MNNTTIEHKNIHEAMVAAAAEVGYVQKQRTAGLNYSYAGEAALIAALRPAMIDHGIYVYVLAVDNVEQSEYETRSGAKMTRSIMRLTVRFQHSSGTYIDAQACGEGADSGDKSINKAMTGAYKYALRETFCIETGDDPDKYPSEPHVTSEPQPAKPQPAPEKTVIERVDEKKATRSTGSMTLDEAKAITNRDGVRYGDIDRATLANMLNAMTKKGDPANAEKMVAARMILAEQNGAH